MPSRSTRGIDWDWEMPALFVLAVRRGPASRWRPRTPSQLSARWGRSAEGRRRARGVVLAIAPALLSPTRRGARWTAPSPRVRRAQLRRGDPTTCADRHRALRHVAVRALASPRLLRRAPRPRRPRAPRDGARPLQRDPNNWQYAYGQAIVYGVSGLDPRPFAREALRLNPLDPDAVALVKNLAAAKTAAERRNVTVTATIPSG